MGSIQFKYQNYWLRAFSQIPVILLLAKIEYDILMYLEIKLPGYLYWFISAVIMFVYIALIYKHTSVFFTKSGIFQFDSNKIIFKKHKREISIETDKLVNVSINQVSLYGAQFLKLEVNYMEHNKEKTYKIFSEDYSEKGQEAVGLSDVFYVIRDFLKSSK